MADNVVTTERKRCPECRSRKIRRSHRDLQERIKYPDTKFYRCRKCRTRFMRLPEPDAPESEAPDQGLADDAAATTIEDEEQEPQGSSSLRFVLIFVVACILTGLFIFLLGRR